MGETNSQQLPFSIESLSNSLRFSLRFSLDHTLSDYFDIDILDFDTSEETSDEISDNDQVAEPYGAMEYCSLGSSRSNSMMRRCRSLLTKRMLKRYLDLILIMPIYRKVIKGIRSGKRLSSKVDALDHDLSKRSCDSETSIHEAVLHCKRSVGSSIDR